jgi:hypothetical protein
MESFVAALSVFGQKVPFTEGDKQRLKDMGAWESIKNWEKKLKKIATNKALEGTAEQVLAKYALEEIKGHFLKLVDKNHRQVP